MIKLMYLHWTLVLWFTGAVLAAAAVLFLLSCRPWSGRRFRGPCRRLGLGSWRPQITALNKSLSNHSWSSTQTFSSPLAGALAGSSSSSDSSLLELGSFFLTGAAGLTAAGFCATNQQDPASGRGILTHTHTHTPLNSCSFLTFAAVLAWASSSESLESSELLLFLAATAAGFFGAGAFAVRCKTFS